MISQLRAELLKLRTTTTMLIYLAVTVALTAVVLIMTAVMAGQADFGPLTDASTQRSMITASGATTVIALFLGAITLSGEVRHKTIVPTLLVTPSRGRLVAAAGVAALLAGGVLGMAAAATSWVGTYAVLAATGTETALTTADVVGPTLGTVASAALSALLGLGIGGIARNQALAVAAVSVLIFVLDPLVGGLLPDLASWMPGRLTTTLAAGDVDGETSLLLAGTVVLGYGIATSLGAWASLRRADIR